MTGPPAPDPPGAEEERWVGDLRISIDRTLCVGFGDCVELAPGGFALDEEGLAVFTTPESVEPEALLGACRACPVDALCARNRDGEQLAP